MVSVAIPCVRGLKSAGESRHFLEPRWATCSEARSLPCSARLQLRRDVADCLEGSMSGYFREVSASIAVNAASLCVAQIPSLLGTSLAARGSLRAAAGEDGGAVLEADGPAQPCGDGA